MGWTDERVEEMKRLWLEGLSAAQIAKRLGGVTRNAVIGKVHRLGLTGRAAPSRPAKATVVRPPRPPALPKPRRIQPVIAMSPGVSSPFPVNRESPPEGPIPTDAFSPLEGSTPLPLMDRPAKACSWPVGEDGEGRMLVCCEPVAARWCLRHEAINRAKAGKSLSTAELERGLRRYV